LRWWRDIASGLRKGGEYLDVVGAATDRIAETEAEEGRGESRRALLLSEGASGERALTEELGQRRQSRRIASREQNETK
jgi:hypothetical protein